MTAAPIRALVKNSKPDAQLLRWIETAKAAGLNAFKVTKRGRELTLEVVSNCDQRSDDLESRIQRMATNGSE